MNLSAHSMTIVKELQIVALPECANVAVLWEHVQLMWQGLSLPPHAWTLIKVRLQVDTRLLHARSDYIFVIN